MAGWSIVIFTARLAAGEQRRAFEPCVCALSGHAGFVNTLRGCSGLYESHKMPISIAGSLQDSYSWATTRPCVSVRASKYASFSYPVLDKDIEARNPDQHGHRTAARCILTS